ncbi:MAG: potassium transporter [Bacteroidetes bacterium GWE2_42_24]|nr:MAG: potassium transporter [Bacteroidetes bacterium GWE2_42_24]OFY25502.1 MAG: potassium transporter [Bacteroidetes bacterium GWF2_43_11]
MYILGLLLLIEAAAMLSCLPVSIWYNDSAFLPLLISSGITALSGFLLWYLNRNSRKENLGKREGYVIVSLSWIIFSLFGALPFFITVNSLSFTDAFFETMSGFTTTGSTIFSDIESLPEGLLYWRALTHWLGGMGIIVLSLAILPLLGIGGMQLFAAEVPGITKDKLHPRIKETAKRLWGIYILLTFLQAVLLMFGGMNLYESLCHAYATMATGGFSTRNGGMMEFSPYIQYVVIVFMFLAGANFTLHYWLLKGKLRIIWKNDEFRFYLILVLIATILITIGLLNQGALDAESSFRHALFQVVSIITTTGFVSDNYLLWPGSMWFILFLLMFVGGSAGSTGGGIKVVRHLLLLRNSRLELRRLIHPMAVIPVRLNGKAVSENVIFKVTAFFLIYVFSVAFGTFAITLLGIDFETSAGAVTSAIGNIGPGIGLVGPICNFSFLPDLAKWLLSFLMLIGRLELFTVLILFSPSFWKS